MRNTLILYKKRTLGYESGKEGYGGFTYGLINSAKFVGNYLNSRGIETQTLSCVDGNEIDKLIMNSGIDPELVFIEALWVTPEKMQELMRLKRHQHRKWIVRIHSKLSFLAYEGQAFDSIFRYDPRIIIAPNTPDLTQSLRELGINTKYLPNIYYPHLYEKKPFAKDDRRIVDVAIFCAIRPMKSMLAQSVAAIKFAKKIDKNLRLHIISDRLEQKSDGTLKNLRSLFKHYSEQHTPASLRESLGNYINPLKFELVEHSWMHHKEFIDLVRQMDIGMQVSMSETYNIVAADFASQNIPIVTSEEVNWLPEECWASVNSVDDIANTMYNVYSRRSEMIENARRHLMIETAKAELIWDKFYTERC